MRCKSEIIQVKTPNKRQVEQVGKALGGVCNSLSSSHGPPKRRPRPEPSYGNELPMAPRLRHHKLDQWCNNFSRKPMKCCTEAVSYTCWTEPMCFSFQLHFFLATEAMLYQNRLAAYDILNLNRVVSWLHLCLAHCLFEPLALSCSTASHPCVTIQRSYVRVFWLKKRRILP